ncbi:hypothetical protein P7C71_g4579, partial [Lecanoromycetidae sp. Uapishka_2]
MPDLLSLSNEILYKIVALIDPSGIEAFAASCCRLFTLSRTAVQQHRQYRKAYTTINVGEHGHFVGPHPIHFLCNLLTDSKIAYYPTCMRLGGFWSNEAFDSDSEEEIERDRIRVVACEVKDLIENVVVQCRYVGKDLAEKYVERVLDGDHKPVLALLLTLLSNLEVLEIEGDPGFEFYTMVVQIAEAYHRSELPTLLPLSKLSRVAVSPNDEAEPANAVENFDLFAVFAALPNVRHLVGSYLESGEDITQDTFEWPYGSGTSQLKELNISHSMVMDGSLPSLLGGIAALEKFTYSSGNGHAGWTYQPRKILAALGVHAGQSLTYLYLTGMWIGRPPDQEAPIEVNLQIFTQLKELRVDYTLFKSRHCDCCPQRLVDALPRSIEKVKLEGQIPPWQVRAFLDGLLESKEERLPKLCSLEIQGPAVTTKLVIEICKAVSVALTEGKEIR